MYTNRDGPGSLALGLDDFKEHTVAGVYVGGSGGSAATPAGSAAPLGDASGDTKVQLNIGGQVFATTLPTLLRERSMFSGMFSGMFGLQKDSAGAYFLDRDPTYFRHVLNFLRDGSVPPLDGLTPNDKKLLMREARYYQCTGLITALTVDAKRTKSAHRSELSTEKEYKLIASVSEEDISNVFKKMTMHESYDFESWISCGAGSNKRPGTCHLLFSKKLSRAELSLLDRLDHM